MFKHLRETIKNLNSDVNNVANSEKAKALKKKLLSIGIPIAVVGFLGAFICFVLFTIGNITGFDSEIYPYNIIIPFILFVPLASVGGIGAMFISFGLQIIIVGYTSNIIDETVGNNCPQCGKDLDPEMFFCSMCGAKIKKECPNCKYINDYKNEYCGKCGNKLD